MNNIKQTLLLIVTVFTIGTQSCSQDPIDKYLDRCEKIISSWQEKIEVGQPLSISSMQEVSYEMQQAALASGITSAIIAHPEKLSTEQQKRILELTQKTTTLFQSK